MLAPTSPNPSKTGAWLTLTHVPSVLFSKMTFATFSRRSAAPLAQCITLPGYHLDDLLCILILSASFTRVVMFKGALQLPINRYGQIRFAQVPERVNPTVLSVPQG